MAKGGGSPGLGTECDELLGSPCENGLAESAPSDVGDIEPLADDVRGRGPAAKALFRADP